MAANLMLALIIIAGVGVLALLLIFVGGANKNKQAKYAKAKSSVKKTGQDTATKSAALNPNQHKEPFISDEDIAFNDDEIISKSNLAANKALDPAIAALGFNALDDLLSEQQVSSDNNISKADTAIIAPAEFNSSPKQKNNEQNILVLHVMAPSGQVFIGYELLQAVTSAGLRFGKMDIFHYANQEQPDNILFSLCAAVEPGTFDIANIGALACPGLSLFMQMSATDNPKAVFNLMLETAGQLAEDLAGHVCDEKRQPLTEAKLHEYLALIVKHAELN